MAIIVVDSQDIHWPFSSSVPVVHVGGGRYPHQEQVDPFPAYGHDPDLVRDVLDQVEALWPLPERHRPDLFILPYESTSRTNGWTSYDYDYDAEVEEGGERPWKSWIALSAKRIPPHPAMTRYLVAHEYGHVVHRQIKALRGVKEHLELEDYAEIRGMSTKKYGGGTWHSSLIEVFANDFRLCITGIEGEFWPHPGIDRPDDRVREWWRQQREAL